MIDDTQKDAAFVGRALARLPGASPPPGFSQALLAAYDAHRPPANRLTVLLRRFSELVWPGAPLWAPGSALAAALLLGIGIGTALPQPAMAERTGFSLEEPPAFSLGSAALLAESRS